MGGLVALACAVTGCGIFEGRAVTVPDAYKSYFVVAARRCPGVLTPAGLAAQARVETKFGAGRTSGAGAEGMMQITPAVFEKYGVDANGDGVKDPFTAADSVATAARYDCVLEEMVRDVPGATSDLYLAAYNAGPQAVLKYGGIPPYPETQNYVKQVRTWTERFADEFTATPAP